MVVNGRRIAIMADAAVAAVHGLGGTFEWGTARTFPPDDTAALDRWAPDTVIGLGSSPPHGTWRTIVWDEPRNHRLGLDEGPPADDASRRLVATSATGVWRRAPLPAADDLADLRDAPGTGVLLVGGAEAERESALAKLRARDVQVRVVPQLTRDDLGAVAVVAMLGAPGQPLPAAAPAVLAAGRLLVAPRAEPAFGLLPWIDHLPYEHLDELACSADAAQSFPKAFEAIAALGVLAAQAHLASAVYGRLAIDAELEDQAVAGVARDASA
jgi:hypothetical protein